MKKQGENTLIKDKAISITILSHLWQEESCMEYQYFTVMNLNLMQI